MISSCRFGGVSLIATLVVGSFACGSSGKSSADAGDGVPDAGSGDASPALDAGHEDASTALDAAADDATVDAGTDADAIDASVDDAGVGLDAGIDPCPTGVYHEPTNRCFFTVLSLDSGLSPCPSGSRLARWFDQDDQRLLQSFLASGSLDSRSVTTSLRRRGYVSGAPWVWDDRTPAPAGLVWASTGHPNLAHVYLTPDGLAPYHRDRQWTLCER